jgi:hypothetical protein
MSIDEGILSDWEIIAVLSFIKWRWPQQVRHQRDGNNEAQKDRENQAACRQP